VRKAGIATVACLVVLAPASLAPVLGAETVETIDVRGKPQKIHLYGTSDGRPAVVASGDGGWVHLGPEVALLLQDRGFAVVGVDCKAYLSSFTSGSRTLTPGEVPGDFAVFLERARRGRTDRVLLAGVSEGAGLAVLAAADPAVQPLLAGVLALGLPRRNELGWRFRDQVIYLTHGIPNEPLFDVSDYLQRLGPVPLAAIHSTNDEFAPLAETKALIDAPGDGVRRLFVVHADNHRFSGDGGELARRLDEALDWLRAERP
jgi:fermentation-respiration switch protein FrsA (DUF1100 family)